MIFSELILLIIDGASLFIKALYEERKIFTNTQSNNLTFEEWHRLKYGMNQTVLTDLEKGVLSKGNAYEPQDGLARDR